MSTSQSRFAFLLASLLELLQDTRWTRKNLHRCPFLLASYIVVEAFQKYQVDVQVARPAGHQSDLVVGGEGILLVRKLLLDELVEELEVLLEGQFVEKCNL